MSIHMINSRSRSRWLNISHLVFMSAVLTIMLLAEDASSAASSENGQHTDAKAFSTSVNPEHAATLRHHIESTSGPPAASPENNAESFIEGIRRDYASGEPASKVRLGQDGLMHDVVHGLRNLLVKITPLSNNTVTSFAGGALSSFDAVTLQVATSIATKNVKATGKVKESMTCAGKFCGFLKHRLSDSASLVVYASPERATAHMVMRNFNLTKHIQMHDAIMGVLVRGTALHLEIGGTIDIPKPEPIFGKGSTFGLGLYLRPGIHDFTAIALGRGKWLSPFGLSIMHVENVRGSASVLYSGQPSGLSLGATVWIGHADEDGKLGHERAIEIQSYAGLKIGLDEPVWFYGSLSELSIGKLWSVLSNKNPNGKFEVPAFITDTSLKDVVFSFAPIETPTSYTIIPAGMRFQASTNIFGFKSRSTFLVEFIWGIPVRVMADFECDPIKLGPVLQIRRFEGSPLGPKVYAEIGLPKIGAYVEGYVNVLGIGAHVLVALDNHNAVFHLDGKLFGVLQASVAVEATNVDYKHLSRANFLARVDISLNSFTQVFQKTMKKLQAKLAKVRSAWKRFKEWRKGGNKCLKPAVETDSDQCELIQEGAERKAIEGVVGKNDDPEMLVELAEASEEKDITSVVELGRVWTYLSLNRTNYGEVQVGISFRFRGKQVYRTATVNLKQPVKAGKKIAKALFKKPLKRAKRFFSKLFKGKPQSESGDHKLTSESDVNSLLQHTEHDNIDESDDPSDDDDAKQS